MEEPLPKGSREVILRDATIEAGLDFVHWNGMSGELYYCEMFGSGAALLDYDNDGDLDLYLVQGRMLGPGKEVADAQVPPRHPLPLSDRLYRNDLAVAADGTRTLRFTDVTAASGIAAPGYGMGVAAGDFDNDGWTDLYVTNLDSNQLWHNQGGGVDGRVTFRDVTATSGADDPRWSVSAAVFDYDRDGWLDLYVSNYVKYSVASDKRCRAATGAPDYCGPQSYRPEPDRLLRNLGAADAIAFEETTSRAGVDRAFGPALGVVTADFNRDGRPDVYVANDGHPNQMWIQQGDGTFTDDALLGGSALNREGSPEAGMGVDAGDFDNDGDEDVILAHLTQETNTLYKNSGTGDFEDVTLTTGVGSATFEMTGFGAAFFDYDNDGLLDLIFVDGAVKVIEALRRAGDPYPLHQTNLLFHNRGDGSFEDVTARAGPAFELSEVSRGVAVGDLDNDGDADVVVVNNSAPARLLLNEVGSSSPPSVPPGGRRHHWLGLRLVGRDGGRDRLGAWVEVVKGESTPGDGASVWRRVSSGGSYASARDPRVLAGLGTSASVREVRVRWPEGYRERFTTLEIDRYHTLREGSGEEIE